MAGITSAGLGSGLDIEGLVSKLVTAEGQPASVRLTRKEAVLQANLSAMGTLKSALSEFQGSIKNLGDLSALLARKATASNTDVFTASANDSAVAGSYSIQVEQLAQSAKLRSGDFSAASDVVGTGTLTLAMGGSSLSITVDDTNKTLEGIRDAINAAIGNPGIKASIMNVDSGAQLMLSSDNIGAGNAITVTTVDDDLNHTDTSGLSRLATTNLTTIQSAQDAVFKVDGQMVTRSSNSISDVITGVTLTLKKKSADGATETLNVEMDKSTVKSKVESFVKAYNALVDTLANLSAYNSETKAAGPLLGDATLRGVQNQVRQVIYDSVSGLTFSSLSQIGVTTDDSNHLKINSSKLDGAMSRDFSAVAKLFASEGGVAKKMEKMLKNYLSSEGVFNAKTKGIQGQIKGIADDRERLGRRLSALETRYRAQFTAMDTLLGKMQTTSSYLAQQLDNLPGFVEKK